MYKDELQQRIDRMSLADLCAPLSAKVMPLSTIYSLNGTIATEAEVLARQRYRYKAGSKFMGLRGSEKVKYAKGKNG